MRNLSLLFASLILCTTFAAAADARIDILAPADGAKIEPMKQYQLDYEVTFGGDGDHAHLYVDGKEKTLLRRKKGSVTLDPLTQGDHEICAKLVNKGHTPIGIERCIKVTAE